MVEQLDGLKNLNKEQTANDSGFLRLTATQWPYSAIVVTLWTCYDAF